MDKTENFKKTISERDKEDRAVSINKQLLFLFRNRIVNSLQIGAHAELMKNEKLYKSSQILDSDGSWRAYCKMILHCKAQTVDKYIDANNFCREKLGLKITPEIDLSGYTVNKVLLLKKVKDPKAWIEPMKEMPISDLSKEINEKEFKIKSDDKDKKQMDRHIKSAEKDKGCPDWKDGKCARDIY